MHTPALILAGLLALACAPAAAQDQAQVRQRLLQWAAAFNDRDAATVCELFADELVSTVPGTPAGGKAEVCGRLTRLLARTDRQFRYAPDIHEVIQSGDLAVVRLTWTLTVSRGSTTTRSVEEGMDVFRRGPDGVWRIVRFIAFTR